MPVCGFSAFLFDGIFIGATASRTMRDSMLVATVAFFAVYYLLKASVVAGSDAASRQYNWNNMLWTAFMVYLAARGLGQALMLRKSVYNQVPHPALPENTYK